MRARALFASLFSSTSSGLQNEWVRRRPGRLAVSLPRRRIPVSSHRGCTGAGRLPAHLGLTAVDTPFMHNENVRCRAVILYTRKQTIIVGNPCPIYLRIICRVGDPMANHKATLFNAERSPKGDLSLIFGVGAEAQLALGQLSDSNNNGFLFLLYCNMICSTSRHLTFIWDSP